MLCFDLYPSLQSLTIPNILICLTGTRFCLLLESKSPGCWRPSQLRCVAITDKHFLAILAIPWIPSFIIFPKFQRIKIFWDFLFLPSIDSFSSLTITSLICKSNLIDYKPNIRKSFDYSFVFYSRSTIRICRIRFTPLVYILVNRYEV